MTETPDSKSYADRAIEDSNFLERLKINNAKDVEIAKEKTKLNKIKAKDNRHARRYNYLASEFGKMLVGWAVAIALVIVLLLACHLFLGWGKHTGETPEELKQDRMHSCTSTGKYDSDPNDDHVWWPTYNNGEGICLPKGQTPPS